MIKIILLLVCISLPSITYAHGSSHHKTICTNTRQMYDLYQTCTKYSYGKEKGTYTTLHKYYFTQEEMDKREREQTITGCLVIGAFILFMGLFLGMCLALVKDDLK